MKKLLYLVMIPLIASGMDKPKDARQIAKEIVRLKKRKAIEEEEQRVTDFLQLPPQPECMGDTHFSKIEELCVPENVPLMQQLIEKDIIKANARKKVYGGWCTLLGVSIYDAVNNGYDLKMVELLLQKGANVDQETMEHGKSTYVPNYATPLEFATINQGRRGEGDLELSLYKLLIVYKADLNKKSRDRTPFMNLVQRYIDRHEKDRPPVYALIKECLQQYGASVDVESGTFCSHWVGTPLEYVRRNRIAPLVELFEEHQKKGNNA